MTLRDVEAGFKRLLLDERPAFFGDDAEGQKRQRVYRRLVRNNLMGTIDRACPHARRLAGDVAFDALVARWLSTSPPTTRLLRDVPGEFTAWLQQTQAQQPTSTPHPSFAELCHFEALEIEVTLSEVSAHAAGPLDEARGLLLDASARLCVYAHPVHHVTSTTTTWPAASAAPVALLCFQRAELFAVQPLSLGVAKVLMLCADGRPLADAIAVVVDEGSAAGVIVDRGRIKADLVDLQRRGALSSSP